MADGVNAEEAISPRFDDMLLVGTHTPATGCLQLGRGVPRVQTFGLRDLQQCLHERARGGVTPVRPHVTWLVLGPVTRPPLA